MAAWLLPVLKPSGGLLSSAAARALLPSSLPLAASAVTHSPTDRSNCTCPRCSAFGRRSVGTTARGGLSVPKQGSCQHGAGCTCGHTSDPLRQRTLGSVPDGRKSFHSGLLASPGGAVGTGCSAGCPHNGCRCGSGSTRRQPSARGISVADSFSGFSSGLFAAPALPIAAMHTSAAAASAATAGSGATTGPALPSLPSAPAGQPAGFHTGAATGAQAARISDHYDDADEQEGRWQDAQTRAAIYHGVRSALNSNAASDVDAELRGVMAPQFLQTPGGRIAYHSVSPAPDALHAPGVIFCGGMMSNMNGTKATFLEMHARRRGHPFVRFDYRGHGASDGEFEDTTLGDWYEDTVAIIDHVSLQGGQHVLVGSSIGAWIALKAAASRREAIKGVVLLAPAVDVTEVWWDAMSPDEQRAARASGFVPLNNSTEAGARLRTEFFDEALDHCILDVAQRDQQVRCPVRIFQGTKDDIVPGFVAQEVFNWLESKDVQLTTVNGGDHRLSRPEDLRSLMGAAEELLDISLQRVPSQA